MDGVSAAASIVALIQISEHLFGLCQEYFQGVKHAREDIQRLRDEILSLQDILINLKELTDAADSAKLSIFKTLNQIDGPVQRCQTHLNGLVTKLDPGLGENRMKQFGLRALKWPFNSKAVNEIIVVIERHKTTFSLALNVDNA